MEKAVSGNICTQTLKVTAQHSQVPSEKEPRHLVFFQKACPGYYPCAGSQISARVPRPGTDHPRGRLLKTSADGERAGSGDLVGAGSHAFSVFGHTVGQPAQPAAPGGR